MLEFYFIPDFDPKPQTSQLKKLVHAGSLDADTFDNLLDKGLIDPRFDYCSDFRWGNTYCKQLASKIKSVPLDSNVLLLKNIVDRAVQAQVGLVAFGD